MAIAPDEINRVQALFGDYEIVDALEHGAQAAVYLATQVSTGRAVVIKLLREGAIVGVGYRQRFMNEVDVISRLDHPNIVTMFDYGETEGYPYYVMKHIRGMAITDYVFAHNHNVRQCIELILPICDAVAYAHGLGIMHRDIKPSNILVSEDGHPYLLDFGLGKMLTENERREELNLTQPEHVVGTIPYMSPEQARGALLDVRSDVYSLAVLLYEMICDELPYDLKGSKEHALYTIGTEEPRSLRSRLEGHERCRPEEITADVRAIMGRALRKERESRYEGVAAFAVDLRSCLGGGIVNARAGESAYLLSRQLKQRWRTTVVVVLVGAVGLLWWGRERMRQEFVAGLKMASIMHLATTTRDNDRLSDAIHLLEDIIAQGERLGADVDQDIVLRLLDAYIYLCEIFIVDDRLEDARVLSNKANALAEQVLGAQPSDLVGMRQLARVRKLAGRLENKAEDSERALDMLLEARHLESQLLAEEVNHDLLREHAVTLKYLTQSYARLKQVAEADACAAEALRINEQLFQEDPSVENRLSLAFAHNRNATKEIRKKTAEGNRQARAHYRTMNGLLDNPGARALRLRDVNRLSNTSRNNTMMIDTAEAYDAARREFDDDPSVDHRIALARALDGIACYRIERRELNKKASRVEADIIRQKYDEMLDLLQDTEVLRSRSREVEELNRSYQEKMDIVDSWFAEDQP